MKLYVLRREGYGWDEFIGFVVRAETPDSARSLAESEARAYADDPVGVWLDEDRSTCEEITSDGAAEIILDSFNAG